MTTESIPPQGFRHAVDLLLKNRLRTLSVDAEALARELVALGDDMKAPPAFAGWVIKEYERVLQRPAPPLLAELGGNFAAQQARRDLFLVYVPEDRLPIAAPLAVELTKRGTSVAFSGFEVESHEQLASAVDRGLAVHGAGAMLPTADFLRRGLRTLSDGRLLVLDPAASSPTQAEALIRWLSELPT
jgi:hypothetical protein